MSDPKRLTFYGYVDRPYEAVRTLMRSRADEVMQRATNTAGERAGQVMARLHFEAHGVTLGVDVRVDLTRKPEEPGQCGLPPITRIGVSWKAAEGSSLFPSMTADITLSPLTFAETRVEFEGVYTPPLSAVGRAIDATIGHRVAEAAVHRFVDDLIAEIRRELPAR